MKNILFLIVLMSLLNLTCNKVEYQYLEEMKKYSINNFPDNYTIPLGDTINFNDSIFKYVDECYIEGRKINLENNFIAVKSGAFDFLLRDKFGKSKNTHLIVALDFNKTAADNQIVFSGALNYTGNMLFYANVNIYSSSQFNLTFNNSVFNFTTRFSTYYYTNEGTQYKCFSKFNSFTQYDEPSTEYFTLTHPTLGTFTMVPKDNSYVNFRMVSSGKYVIDIKNVELHNNASGTSIFINANYMN